MSAECPKCGSPLVGGYSYDDEGNPRLVDLQCFCSENETMKIADCDIEFVFEKEDVPDDLGGQPTSRFHTLRFVKTPRGRRKELLMVEEGFKNGRLVHVDIDLSGAKTRKERGKLVSAMLRGPFRSQTQFDPLTIKMLNTSYLKGVENLFVRFSA